MKLIALSAAMIAAPTAAGPLPAVAAVSGEHHRGATGLPSASVRRHPPATVDSRMRKDVTCPGGAQSGGAVWSPEPAPPTARPS